jgi:hypothetical protein
LHVGGGGGGDVTWLGRVAVLTCVRAPTVRVAVALRAILVAVAVAVVVSLVSIVVIIAAAASLASSWGILILLDLSLETGDS